MNNNYICISLICIIIINSFWIDYYLARRRREGFVDKALGALVDGLVKNMLGSKSTVFKAVKKEKDLGKKLETLFQELFYSFLTIIFVPIGAAVCIFLYSSFASFSFNLSKNLFLPAPIAAFIAGYEKKNNNIMNQTPSQP